MAVNKKLLQGAAAAAGGLTPSEHFGVVTYTGDGSSSNKVGDGSFTVLGLPDTGTAFPYLVSEKVYSSGKYYFEINDLANGDTGNMQCMVGIVPTSFRGDMTYPWKTGNGGLFWYQANGQLYVNGSGSGSFGTFAAGDDVAVAVDFDNNTMTLYKNGSQSGSQISGVPSGTYHMSVSTGYNQYKGKAALKETLMQYSIPSGYEAWGGDIDTSGDWSNYSEYDGVLNFTPDFIWFKTRTQAYDHNITDSTRGTGKQVRPNRTIAEVSATDLITSFDTGGFTVGSGGDANKSGDDYVAWCLKANGGTTSSNTDGTVTTTVQANQDAGFSIVTWTGGSSGTATTGHGLSATPDLIIQRPINATSDWFIWHKDLTSGNSLRFTTAAQSTAIAFTVNSSIFYTNWTNTSYNWLAYCFHSVEGFSKFGSYTGNGSDNGPIVETGFEPAFVMIKRSSGTGNWQIWDNKRSTTNTRDKLLFPNDSAAEQTLAYVDFLSNGFQVVDASGATGGTNVNISGSTYIYMAFAADPDTEAPTVAKSFDIQTWSGDNDATRVIDGYNFEPSLVWIKWRTGTYGHSHMLFTNLLNDPNANSALSTNSTAALNGYKLTTFTDDGFQFASPINAVNETGFTFVGWAWKADDNEPTIYGGAAKAVYKFEDNLNDVTGNNNSNASASITYNSSGKFNKSVDFNGTSSYFTVSSLNNLFDTWTSISYSLWIKTTDSSAQFLVGTATDEQNYKALASISSGKLTPVTRKSGTVYSASSSTSINDGNWHHIVITYDNDNGITKGYVDGVEEVSFATGGSSSGSLTIHNVSVGANYQSGNGNFYNGLDGEIDQLRFYNGVINDIGVAALYAETASDNDNVLLGGPPETIISANANAGFSIVKYEGDGTSNARVPHGLSSTPEMIIVKELDGTSSWQVHHTGLSANKVLLLNSSSAEANPSTDFNNGGLGTVNATTFGFVSGLTDTNNVNESGLSYIAYCFHSVSGYSKIGSYTGNGTTQSITGLGFQPDWLLIKQTNASNSWRIFDSVRGLSSPQTLFANLSVAEDSESSTVSSFDSDGWTMGSQQGVNDNGDTYIYMAFKIN